jgi:spore coat polysaccharide biosynthesis protein SpsF (cytidylyltransferase family)
VTEAVIVLQARMGSSRLPGKALARIGTRTVVGHCLARLMARQAAPLILATTAGADDDCLVHEAERYGADVFRGSSTDVLNRFVETVRGAGARYVVRATGDNPAVDLEAPGRTLALLRSTGADYVREDGLPCGAGVEAMTAKALELAALIAEDPADREHVTAAMRRDRSRFNVHVGRVPRHLRRPDLRLTLDTDDDLEYLRRISSRLGDSSIEAELEAIIVAADACAGDRRALVARGKP